MIWRPIPGYSLFEASEEGQIRRVAYKAGTKGPNHPLPHVLAGWINNRGYPYVNVSKDGGGYQPKQVHRLVLMAFKGLPPEGKPLGCHIDGDRTNNRADNLYWGSAADNGADKVRLGEAATFRGNHPRAKLTEHSVRIIMRELGQGKSPNELADRFGVVPGAILNIRAGRTWAWLEDLQ